MKCPYCSYDDDKVVDSRSSHDGMVIRRRRECTKCTKRYTTYERIEEIPLRVIKKDNSREDFDRQKLMAGILKACEKRPVSIEQIENVVEEIEKALESRYDKEVKSGEIGELMMIKLKGLDDIAYVRFASVYRQFKDIEQFMNEVKSLKTVDKKKKKKTSSV